MAYENAIPAKATRDDDRLVQWAECRRMPLDINFVSGQVKLEKRKFKSIAEALAWATTFSTNWGLPTP